MQAKVPEISYEQQHKAVLNRLRKSIGILGLLLPTIIYALHGTMLSSISHYYYTSSSIFFTGILSCFGLILMAYKGHIPEAGEKISDNTVTSIAGFFAIVAVIIPTCCVGSGDATINCGETYLKDYLLGHLSTTNNIIHLISAALFIVLLGWMCVYKFTRSKTEKGKKYHTLYRICGYVVWASVGCIALIIALDTFTNIDFDIKLPNYTFILESVALYAFAVAWLVKGNINEVMAEWRGRFLKK